MALFKYAELATVAVTNSYYANGICKKYHVAPLLDFELVPTNECAALMKKLDFIFRSDDHGGGFMVLGRVSGTIGGDDLLRPDGGSRIQLRVEPFRLGPCHWIYSLDAHAFLNFADAFAMS